MPEDEGTDGWGSRLEDLWADVVSARAAVAEQRHDPQHHPGTAPRSDLILALEAYLGYIIQRGYPAPYLLVNELTVQRRVSRWVGSASR